MNLKFKMENFAAKGFLEKYLEACGVTPDLVEDYICVDDGVYAGDPPSAYKNMEEAAKLLLHHLTQDNPIGIIQDSDCDGLCSAVIIYDYLRRYCGATPCVYFHTGKQHGLRPDKGDTNSILDQVKASGVKLLIEPDAGSNDAVYHKALKEKGIDTLVLDHHMIEDKEPVAVVVNCNDPDNHTNRDFPGAGVTWQFVRYFHERCQDAPWLSLPDFYPRLVAMAIVSDNCDLRSLENRLYVSKWLSGAADGPVSEDKGTFDLFLEKLVSRGRTPEGYSWGVIPPINAVMRCGSMEDKELLFRAFVGEADSAQALKASRAAHRRQSAITKQVVEDIEAEGTYNRGAVNVGFIDQEYRAFSGLIANKLCGATNKPTLILRQANPTQWSGSIRSPRPIATIINKSKLGKCEGHEEACGIMVNKARLERLIDFINGLGWDKESPVEVAAELNPVQINLKLADTIVKNADMWGVGIPKPLFYWHTDYMDNVQVFQKKSTTLKFALGGVDFLLFRASQEDIDKMAEACDNGGVVQLVFSLSVNEWEGNRTPQAIIEAWDIIYPPADEKPKEESWEDVF